jgi:ribosomal protein S18 acetylase RimI-like enzyme
VTLTTPQERVQIVQIAVETGVFSNDEIETVDELLDGYFDDPEVSGYNFLSYRDGARVLGFATWGPRDLAGRGYDLYWIATRPGAQRRGVARALMTGVEDTIRARGGGWIWIETSDTPPYAAARSFYERCGYQRLAILPDFFRVGDGLVVFAGRVG